MFMLSNLGSVRRDHRTRESTTTITITVRRNIFGKKIYLGPRNLARSGPHPSLKGGEKHFAWIRRFFRLWGLHTCSAFAYFVSITSINCFTPNFTTVFYNCWKYQGEENAANCQSHNLSLCPIFERYEFFHYLGKKENHKVYEIPIPHMNILVDLRVQTLALVHLRGSLQLRFLSAPLAINIGAQICAPEVHRCPFVHYARFGSACTPTRAHIRNVLTGANIILRKTWKVVVAMFGIIRFYCKSVYTHAFYLYIVPLFSSDVMLCLHPCVLLRLRLFCTFLCIILLSWELS